MFKIKIEKLKVKAKIGVSNKERKKSQLLIVTLVCTYNLSNKTNLDNIKNLKDYSAITKYLKNYIEESKYKTLEKLIFECSKKIKKEFQLDTVYLNINKTAVAKKYGCNSLSVSQ